MPLLPIEIAMWETQERSPAERLTDSEISDKYHRGEGRIVVENNREKLRGFVDQLERSDYMDLRPFYQRRPRWKAERQSLLIESFIINVPVPPVFLYERDFNTYEVMDGQQRITAIRDFYQNKFALVGLKYWPELNGRYYHNLPPVIQSGIDRRSISSIIMLKESATIDEEAMLLRQLVFERLNTGGIALKRQEIRNAIYQGPVNDLILELSRHSVIRRAWGLPLYSPQEIERADSALLRRPFFSEMEDAELVLRFLALRNASQYRGGMQGFLDLYMIKAADFSDHDIHQLGALFDDTISIAEEIYGDLVFRPYELKKQSWAKSPHKAIFDAVMVAVSENLDHAKTLIARREAVIDATAELFSTQPAGTFTGQKNTKSDVMNRIQLMSGLLKSMAS